MHHGNDATDCPETCGQGVRVTLGGTGAWTKFSERGGGGGSTELGGGGRSHWG